MNTFHLYITEHLEDCEYRKRLETKTLKAYRIDLKQYESYLNNSLEFDSRASLDKYITCLHKQYKPKTVKRKIASLKALFHYLEYKELLLENPFSKLDILFREAKLLPSTISFHSIQAFLLTLYEQEEKPRRITNFAAAFVISLSLDCFSQLVYEYLSYAP